MIGMRVYSAAPGGATATLRVYRKRLAAAAIASFLLHLLLARGLAVTTLGLDGRAADAQPAPKPARRPAKDFAIHAPRATAAAPAHERPLAITVAPRDPGRSPPVTRTATERRPDAADASSTGQAAAPVRPRDLEMAAPAAPDRSSPVTPPAAATALADAAAAAPAAADAGDSPAAFAREHDAPDTVASRWRPREVALLERLIAPAPMQPGSVRDDAGDDRPTAATATDADRTGRRPVAVSGAKAAA
ncbi:MAG: hypothetical protein ACKOZU_04105, partial [Planctomycetaceae bacterium]